MIQKINKKKYIIITISVIIIGIFALNYEIFNEYNKFKNKTYAEIVKEFGVTYAIVDTFVNEYKNENNVYPLKYNYYIDFNKLKIKEPDLFINQGNWIISNTLYGQRVKFKVNEESILNKTELFIILGQYIEH